MSGSVRSIVLRRRPQGLPCAEDFELVTAPCPVPAEGEFLVRNSHIGLAPSSRMRMSEVQGDQSYDAPTRLGGVIHGQTLGQIVETRHPDYRIGETVVLTAGGWQEMSVCDGTLVRRVDESVAPATYWLGALGVSGLTAYAGLMEVGALTPGETVVVSAASGGVGSVAAQIARASGCHVIGIAGGAAKCRSLLEELRLDAAVDYKAPTFADALRSACEGGVDLYFDNTGGPVRDAMLGQMARHGRIVVCGLVAEYNGLGGSTGPGWLPILARQLTVRGFLMRDFLHLEDRFVRDVGGWLKQGRIAVREDVTQGFENTPEAFVRMLSGKTFGKAIVQV